MKVIKETSILNFEAWAGAVEALERIRTAAIEDPEIVNRFDEMIDEWYPDGIGETELNDLLWFDCYAVYEYLDILTAEDGE